MNACRSASFLKVGSAACIPVPEQFVEFTSGAPSPPQFIKVALRAITNTIYLEFIKFFLFTKSSIWCGFKPEVQQQRLLGVAHRHPKNTPSGVQNHSTLRGRWTNHSIIEVNMARSLITSSGSMIVSIFFRVSIGV